MTKWERYRANELADCAIMQALNHFESAKEPLRESQVLAATASCAMLAQQRGNLALWVGTCIAIAEKLAQSFVKMENCIADAKKASKHEGVFCSEVR